MSRWKNSALELLWRRPTLIPMIVHAQAWSATLLLFGHTIRPPSARRRGALQHPHCAGGKKDLGPLVETCVFCDPLAHVAPDLRGTGEDHPRPAMQSNGAPEGKVGPRHSKGGSSGAAAPCTVTISPAHGVTCNAGPKRKRFQCQVKLGPTYPRGRPGPSKCRYPRATVMPVRWLVS